MYRASPLLYEPPLFEESDPRQTDLTLTGVQGDENVKINKAALLLRCLKDHPLWLNAKGTFAIRFFSKAALEEFVKAINRNQVSFKEAAQVFRLWRTFELATCEEAEWLHNLGPRTDGVLSINQEEIIEDQWVRRTAAGEKIEEKLKQTAFVPPPLVNECGRDILYAYRLETMGNKSIAAFPRPHWNPYLNFYNEVRHEIFAWAAQINWVDELLNNIVTWEGKKYVNIKAVDPRMDSTLGFVMVDENYGYMAQAGWSQGAYLQFIEYKTGSLINIDSQYSPKIHRSFYIQGSIASIQATVNVMLDYGQRISPPWDFGDQGFVKPHDAFQVSVDRLRKREDGEFYIDFNVPWCVNENCPEVGFGRSGHIEKTCTVLPPGIVPNPYEPGRLCPVRASRSPSPAVARPDDEIQRDEDILELCAAPAAVPPIERAPENLGQEEEHQQVVDEALWNPWQNEIISNYEEFMHCVGRAVVNDEFGQIPEELVGDEEELVAADVEGENMEEELPEEFGQLEVEAAVAFVSGDGDLESIQDQDGGKSKDGSK